MKNEGIDVDTLFVGPTRPAMLWGVTWQAFVINTMVTMEFFIWTQNLLWLLLFVPLHAICYLVCMNDPRTFELLAQWGKTKGRAFAGNFRYWRAASYSPLALHVARKPTRASRRRCLRLNRP
jgi:type IV secretion system protein VirB3